jgi:hypothetical protein
MEIDMRTVLPVLALVACGGPETNFRNLAPEISVTPEALDLGEVIVTQSGTAELYVSNAGQADLDVGLALQGSDTFSLDLLEATLEPDTSQTFVVTFTPDNFLPYEATVVVTSNDADSPTIEVPLTGEGVDAPKPDIDVTPLTIDFGDAAVGAVGVVEFFDIENVGQADLTLGTITQQGSPAFVLVNDDPSGDVVAPGSSATMILQYQPVQDAGDNGTFTIPSDDPDEPEVVVTLIGNGGGDFEYPVADIDCPLQVFLTGPEYVNLDGSASSDPAGLELTYTWELVRAPVGSSSELFLLDSTLSDVDVLFDLAGTYEVQLTVTNSNDTPSVPTKCVVQAIPEDEIRVELIWDGSSSDLDLHLGNRADAELYDADEANWCNPSPDWGSNGADDDPRLDIDDRGGFGPENINVLSPADGVYPVKVHYYEDNNDDLVTATVSVWSKDQNLWTGSKVLARDEVWDVGQLNWPQATFADFDTPVYDAPARGCP